MPGVPRAKEIEPPPTQGVDVVHEYRISTFVELGFTVKEAERLAVSRDRHGVHVYWRSVKDMLDAGCSHVLAVKLLS